MHKYIMKSTVRLLCLVLIVGPAYAGTQLRSAAAVIFSGCTEFAAEGPISLTGAQGLVPSSYTITGASSGVAQIVVRATSCQGLTVDGWQQGPAIVAHIGINIESPDGTGDINNYTIIYATTSISLARSLRHLGLPALYSPSLAYEFYPRTAMARPEPCMLRFPVTSYPRIFSTVQKLIRPQAAECLFLQTGGTTAALA
jgi:hypothetical protein